MPVYGHPEAVCFYYRSGSLISHHFWFYWAPGTCVYLVLWPDIKKKKKKNLCDGQKLQQIHLNNFFFPYCFEA